MQPIHFNPEALEKIIGKDKAITRTLLEDLVKGSEKTFALLQENYKGEMWNSVRGNAHFLKSNFRYLGNQRMVELLRSVENFALDESKRKDIRELMVEFEQVFPDVMKEVKSYIVYLK